MLINFILPILPELCLFSSALVILLADIFFKKNNKEFYLISYLIALISCILTLYFLSKTGFETKAHFNKMFLTSNFTTLVKFVTILLLSFILVLSFQFFEDNEKISSEFISLIMISSVGAMILISANDFITLYLGIELQSLPLYLLAAINKKSPQSSESGIKYFVLGSTASAILLLGISFFYGFSGTTNFETAFQLYQISQVPPALILGFVLIIIALFFKISAAPFHMWAPDVYQGSSTIVTTFFATVAKFSATLIFVRIFLDVSTGFRGIENILMLVAILSIGVGSFGAIKQNNIKRLLAYSSIGHIGFVILGLSSLSLDGVKSCVIYMTIYSIISIGTFGFLTLIINITSNDGKDFDEIDNNIFSIKSFAGLSKTNPIMAAIFACLMFSSAGIPPLAGFFSKFYVIVAAVKSGNFLISIIAVLFSVISAFYYLKIVKIMYFDEPSENNIIFIKRINPKIIIALVAVFNLLFIILLKDFLSTISSMLGF